MSWEPIVTPNPNVKALRVWVDKGTVLSLKGTYTAGVTTLAQFQLGEGPGASELQGDYIYTYPEGPNADGQIAFYFAPKIEDNDLLVPFESYVQRIGNHRWPDVVKSLAIVADYSFPRSTNIVRGGEAGIVVGPSYHVAEELIPEINEGSSFYVEDFIGHTWFTLPRYRVPVATAVSVMIPGGGRYQHQEALHDDIEVDGLTSANATFISDAMGAAVGNVGAQRNPATNMTRWRAYWLSDEQVRRDGVIYRRRIRVRPPRVPASIFQLS